ncbi:hypothetical protein [Hyphococcus luteus]|nr:hypothetical protein [Marinicaulis flavus]
MKPTRPVSRAARGGAVCAAALIAAGVFASAFARPNKDEDILSKYEKTGETVSCLSLRSVRDTDVIDDYAMLVEAGGEVYLNELNGRCIGLAREERYVHDAVIGRMCRGDIIRVMDSFGNPLGSCSLGDFEKLNEISETDQP